MTTKNYLETNASDYTVFPVAGAAYGKRGELDHGVSLTHAYDDKANRVLCGKVKAENILDDWTQVSPDAPTCATCAARLAKLAAKAGA